MNMKKTMAVLSVALFSTAMLAGCESMNANEQRIGAAAGKSAEHDHT